MKSFLDIFPDTPDIHIVDVGASPIDGDPIYQPILDRGGYRLTGFEPDPRMFSLLESDDKRHYFNYALGDGETHTLNLFEYPGMNSFLDPEPAVLDTVLQGEQFGHVIDTMPIQTVRLDNIKMWSIDFLKLDIQGYELTVLQNSVETLKNTLVIHIEVMFVPFYKKQALFGDIDVFLRSQGFMLHKLGEIHQTQAQMYWTDAVYVKDFTKYDELSADADLKLARIMHDVYGSFDIAELAMKAILRGDKYKMENKDGR